MAEKTSFSLGPIAMPGYPFFKATQFSRIDRRVGIGSGQGGILDTLRTWARWSL